MSDKWQSAGRSWCDYCRMFVYNNAISKRNHENDPRHKANFKRVVDDQVRQQRKKERESEQVKKELERISPSSSSSYTLNTARSNNLPSFLKRSDNDGPKEYVHGQLALESRSASIYKDFQKRKEEAEAELKHAADLQKQAVYESGSVENVSSVVRIGTWEKVKSTALSNKDGGIDEDDFEVEDEEDGGGLEVDNRNDDGDDIEQVYGVYNLPRQMDKREREEEFEVREKEWKHEKVDIPDELKLRVDSPVSPVSTSISSSSAGAFKKRKIGDRKIIRKPL